MPPPSPPTISLGEAAERLGVHYMTAYRYVRTGRLPATRVGGQWVVDPRDLTALPAASPPGRTQWRPLGEGDDAGGADGRR